MNQIITYPFPLIDYRRVYLTKLFLDSGRRGKKTGTCRRRELMKTTVDQLILSATEVLVDECRRKPTRFIGKPDEQVREYQMDFFF